MFSTTRSTSTVMHSWMLSGSSPSSASANAAGVHVARDQSSGAMALQHAAGVLPEPVQEELGRDVGVRAAPLRLRVPVRVEVLLEPRDVGRVLGPREEVLQRDALPFVRIQPFSFTNTFGRFCPSSVSSI